MSTLFNKYKYTADESFGLYYYCSFAISCRRPKTRLGRRRTRRTRLGNRSIASSLRASRALSPQRDRRVLVAGAVVGIWRVRLFSSPRAPGLRNRRTPSMTFSTSSSSSLSAVRAVTSPREVPPMSPWAWTTLHPPRLSSFLQAPAASSVLLRSRRPIPFLYRHFHHRHRQARRRAS
jgi:hypothetical protein